jgi:hypothetical protein
VCTYFIILSLHIIRFSSWRINDNRCWTFTSQEVEEQLQKLSFSSFRRQHDKVTSSSGGGTVIVREKQEAEEKSFNKEEEEKDEVEERTMTKLKAKASRLLYHNNREGLSNVASPKNHYAFTTFKLSLGQSASFVGK